MPLLGETTHSNSSRCVERRSEDGVQCCLLSGHLYPHDFSVSSTGRYTKPRPKPLPLTPDDIPSHTHLIWLDSQGLRCHTWVPDLALLQLQANTARVTLLELKERLVKADETLSWVADSFRGSTPEADQSRTRLLAKVSGVRLVLSYVEEALNQNQPSA